MSKQATDLQSAKNELDRLQEKKADLQARLTQLELAGEKIDFSNVDAAVSKIASNQAARQATQTALLSVAAEIALAEGRLDDYKRAEREARLAALSDKEMERIGAAVDSLQVLADALAELDEVQGAMRGERGKVHEIIPVNLRREVKSSLEYFRSYHPEFLGLPPRPTLAEAARLMAEADYNRARASLARVEAELKQAKDESNWTAKSEFEKQINVWTRTVAYHKQRLEALEMH